MFCIKAIRWDRSNTTQYPNMVGGIRLTNHLDHAASVEHALHAAHSATSTADSTTLGEAIAINVAMDADMKNTSEQMS